jgi:hypothetical protein
MRRLLSIKPTAEAAHDFSMIMKNANFQQSKGSVGGDSLVAHQSTICPENVLVRDLVISLQAGRLKFFASPAE